MYIKIQINMRIYKIEHKIYIICCHNKILQNTQKNKKQKEIIPRKKIVERKLLLFL